MGAAARILIVEDSVSWQKRLHRHLQSVGLAADIAQNLAETRLKLEGGHYELVTVDINLEAGDRSNRDGLEVLKILNLRHIKAIVVRASGEDSQETSRQVIEETYKPFAYFHKYQYSYEKFCDAARQALASPINNSND